MNTRRHPRTMREAFGPYTTDHLLPMREDRRKQDIYLTIVSVVALVVMVATSFIY